MSADLARAADGAAVGAGMLAHQPVTWHCHTRVDKYDAAGVLYESLEVDGNMLVTGGASALLQRLIGTGVTAFDNTNAHIGVGNSATAEATTDTDLVGASKFRKVVDATYPQHTDSTSVVGAKTVTYRASFADGEANFAWAEWGIFNAAAAGRMLNRKVQSLGTKVSGSWVLTCTITLS